MQSKAWRILRFGATGMGQLQEVPWRQLGVGTPFWNGRMQPGQCLNAEMFPQHPFTSSLCCRLFLIIPEKSLDLPLKVECFFREQRAKLYTLHL